MFKLIYLTLFTLGSIYLVGSLLVGSVIAGHCSPERGRLDCPASVGFCVPENDLNGRWFCDVEGKDEHKDSGVTCGDPKHINICPSSEIQPQAQGPQAAGGGSVISNPALDKVFGTLTLPAPLSQILGGKKGDVAITDILSKVVELIYIFAAIVFVFYILYSALEFIYSEGHKENIQEARGRIIWAIIGIVILALVFVFLRVLGQITGFTFFQ